MGLSNIKLFLPHIGQKKAMTRLKKSTLLGDDFGEVFVNLLYCERSSWQCQIDQIFAELLMGNIFWANGLEIYLTIQTFIWRQTLELYRGP